MIVKLIIHLRRKCGGNAEKTDFSIDSCLSL
jgi:hypothetical protein